MGRTMSIELNTIVDGKVSGITKFGAFIDINGGGTGMVHISEVSQTYVNDINDFLKVGDTVKAKVISCDKGKVALSIKQTQPKPGKSQNTQKPKPKQRKPYKPAPPVTSPGSYEWQSAQSDSPSSFEDMMSMFKRTSEDKMSDLKRAGGESRGYSRRGNSSRK